MMKLVGAAALGAGLVLAAAVPASAIATLPTPGDEKPTSKKVPASLLGMHVHSLTNVAPTPEQRFGSIRIWDNGVRWDQVNTAKGVYDWTLLDKVVANARASGAKDIMYVMGYTPAWAAKNVKPLCEPPNYKDCEYFPGGSSSGPKDIEDWKTWVRAVASRYKGQITQYQIWNEANLTSMFSSTGDSAVEMAELTVAAEKAVRQVDDGAEVISASSTIVQKKNFVKKSWLTQYLTSLKKQGGKPDGIAIHAYPWVDNGPGNGNLAERAKGVDMAREAIAKAGYKKLPMLDTEMNYGNQRDNGWPKKKYSEGDGAAYLAQTYLESLHNGLAQVDWYGWDDYVLGIWTTSQSGAVLEPGVAYQTLLKNLPGKKNKGCTITKKVTVCLTTKGSTRDYYVYRPKSKKVSFKVPSSFKVKQACDVLGECKPIRKGKVKVGLSPLRLTNG